MRDFDHRGVGGSSKRAQAFLTDSALGNLKLFGERFQALFSKPVGTAVDIVRPNLTLPDAKDPFDHRGSELAQFLMSCRKAFWGLAVFSGLSNLLMLTGSFFMLQVYDRVLPSRSVPTLIGLLVLATMLYALQGLLDLIRGRIGIRLGRFLDETLSLGVYVVLFRLPLRSRRVGVGIEAVSSFD